MSEQADGAADRLAMGGQIDAEHDARCPERAEEAGAEPQQRGLAGAVRAPQQHDLALLDPQRGSGERRELSEHGDRVIELHDRHGRHARS